MQKANELIGKSIVAQGTGDRLARVYDVVVDQGVQRLVALLTESGGWLRDARVVPWDRIVSIGDVIIVRSDVPAIVKANESDVADQVAHPARITGTKVMTDSGEELGTVGDLFIDDTGRILGYEVKHGFLNLAGRKFLPAAQVQTVGQDALITTSDQLPSAKSFERGTNSEG